jgi:hypothetical protein
MTFALALIAYCFIYSVGIMVGRWRASAGAGHVAATAQPRRAIADALTAAFQRWHDNEKMAAIRQSWWTRAVALDLRQQSLCRGALAALAAARRIRAARRTDGGAVCLIASLFEGPTRFKVSNVSREADGAFRVRVHFWYEEDAGWEDAIIIRKESGRLAIDDIVLSGAGDFNPPGRLSDNLK